MRLSSSAIIYGLGAAACLMGLPAAAAAEADCTEAKQLLGVVKAFYEADAEYRNQIEPSLTLRLASIGDHPQPDGIRYIYEAETIDLLLDEEGTVLGLEKAVDFHKEGKLCKLVNGALAEEIDEPTSEVSMNFRFPFKNTAGQHHVEDLLEGAKDGSKVMKALAPGGLGFVVPGLKSFTLKPAEKEGPVPKISFWRKGQEIEGPQISKIGTSQLFKSKDLKKTKADEVKISGEYILEAFFKYDADEIAKAEAARIAKLEKTNEKTP